ncbi:TRAP transporter small permease [uncultured Paracoccus sp.]|uniref:TRAP transporter small permease n=1 Tax=uncultured Paracoccus sp. TaxID=189685 RepID=UPI00262E7C3A|nr:TRAP transporter small permease [uncultured Paracoccus sp.]
MDRAAALIRALLRVATGLSFAVLMAAVLLQVFARTFLGSSPVWTEELTRFALLYLAAFGTALSLSTGDLVNVDLVSESLPGRSPWMLRLVSALITLGFCLVLIWPAWRFTAIGAMQGSPALGLKMSWIHAAVLLMLAALALAAAIRVAGMLRGTTDGLPEHAPGEIE